MIKLSVKVIKAWALLLVTLGYSLDLITTRIALSYPNTIELNPSYYLLGPTMFYALQVFFACLLIVTILFADRGFDALRHLGEFNGKPVWNKTKTMNFVCIFYLMLATYGLSRLICGWNNTILIFQFLV